MIPCSGVEILEARLRDSARAVDENIYRAERLSYTAKERDNARLISDIAGTGKRNAAKRAYLGYRLIQCAGVTRGERHRRASLSEAQRGGAPNPATGPGDERDFTR